ncbi:hypothetical protein PRZ48_014116 [Zasmidium cellare]|uniref:Uncharacterized protein n=1 Tax=Zasmidium cellare TaxID=395010 RepID=A0ABR0E012_ZASCE|nr:hypothetical protein PRZ48_014116 [Zasmidium cellare]
MSTEPPAPIRRFYEEMKRLDLSSLTIHSATIEPRKYSEDKSKNSKLRYSAAKTLEMQDNYEAVQLACFDFIGYCEFCGGRSRHAHSVQGTAVFEIEGFPGLYLYPELLRNNFVLKELLDQLMHRDLACPDGHTNLHDDYHVTYPPHSTQTARQTSFFDPEASQLKMQPRLVDSWVNFPITVTDFVRKLRWFRFTLPTNIKQLIEGIISLEVKSATAHISSPNEMLDLRQIQQRKGFQLDLSLGLDGYIVIGRECQPSEMEQSGPPSPTKKVPDENWRGLLIGLDNEDEKHDQSEDVDTNDGSTDVRDGFHLAAIRLEHGDALLFCDEGLNTWHGVAKVVEGSFGPWEEDWPCWFEKGHDSRFQDWRGCMRGRRIDMVIESIFILATGLVRQQLLIAIVLSFRGSIQYSELSFGASGVTTDVNGLTTVLPIISGGDDSFAIPLTPTTTIAPTGTEAGPSKSGIETQLSSLFPIIQGWIDDNKEGIGPIVSFLDDLQDDTENFTTIR